MDEVESVNILQEQTLNTLEAEIFDNENDIEGKNIIILIGSNVLFNVCSRIILTLKARHSEAWQPQISPKERCKRIDHTKEQI